MKNAKKLFLKGTIVGGRYRMLGRLGEGGMGIVYKATDVTLNTEVVLKVPLIDLTKEANFAQRFKQELQSMIALSHPNIVRLLDLGEEQGVPYAVMPYLAGGDLNSIRPRDASGKYRPVPLATLAEWLVPVAKALDFVHRKGIIHRDIKPANILFDGEGNPFLTDFGIAKLVAQSSDEAGKRMKTHTGVVLGTPDYTAPELIMGQAPDPRSDIFSLAMTVYDLVTGRLPFDDGTPAAVLVKQVTTDIPSPQLLNARLSSHFCHALLQGLQKDPSQRPKTCLAFAISVCDAASRTDKEIPGLLQTPSLGVTEASQHSSSKTSRAKDVPVFKITEKKDRRTRRSGSRPPFLPNWVFGMLSWALVTFLVAAIAYLTVFQVRLFGEPSWLAGKANETKSDPEKVTIASRPAEPLAPPQSDLQRLKGERGNPLIAESGGNHSGNVSLPRNVNSLNGRTREEDAKVEEERPFEHLESAQGGFLESQGEADNGSSEANPIDTATRLAQLGKMDEYKKEMQRLARLPEYEARVNFILGLGHALTRQSKLQDEDDEKAIQYLKKSLNSCENNSEVGEQVAADNVASCLNNLAIVELRRGRLDSSMRLFEQSLSRPNSHAARISGNLSHLRLFVIAADRSKGAFFFRNPSSRSISRLDSLLQANGISPSDSSRHVQSGWSFTPFTLKSGQVDPVFVEVGQVLTDSNCINCRGSGRIDCPSCTGGKSTSTAFDTQIVPTPNGPVANKVPRTVFTPCQNCDGNGTLDCGCCDDGKEKVPH